MNTYTTKMSGREIPMMDSITTALKILFEVYLIMRTIKTGVDLYDQIQARKKVNIR